MIDFFASLTVGLIVVMTLVILYSNFRQARELNQMKKVMQGWVDAQLRDRRAKHGAAISIPDPLQWFGRQANLVLTDLQRNLDDPPALEFLAERGLRLVVSPLPDRFLRSALREVEVKGKKLTKLMEPLLGKRRRDVRVMERNQVTSGEWFDLEAKAAVKACRVDWPDCSHLWFYVISPRPHPVRLVKVDWMDIKKWFVEQKGKLKTWLRLPFSKSSS